MNWISLRRRTDPFRQPPAKDGNRRDGRYVIEKETERDGMEEFYTA